MFYSYSNGSANTSRHDMYNFAYNDTYYDIMENMTLPNEITPDPLEDDGEQPLYVIVILILLYGLVIFLAIGGNIVVCYIVLAYQRMRTVTNFFLLNLAISDILKALLCIPFTFVSNILLMYWPFGEGLCPIVTYIQSLAVLLSAFTLVSMSLDRYIAIVYPLRPRMTKLQALLAIGATWFCAMVVPLPTAIVSGVTVLEENGNGLCLEIWNPSQQYAYSLSLLILQYFLPLVVLSFTYGRIGYIIWIKAIPGEAERKRDQKMAASKRKMIKMMIVVVVIYAICWLPLHAIQLVGDQDTTIYAFPYMRLVWTASHWLAMSHSCYNPIVYFWMNSKFRIGLKKAFSFCPCRNKRTVDDNFSSFHREDTYSTSLQNSVSCNKQLTRNVGVNGYKYNKTAIDENCIV